jgi:hypothetical protein
MNQAVKEFKKPITEDSQANSEAKPTKKIKATIYLSEEAEQAFAELYADRYVKDRKTDRSMIACEAILDLYKKDNATKQESGQS